MWKFAPRRTDHPVFSGPLPRFIAAAMLIAVLGAVVDQSLLFNRRLAAALLRYYWFRSSDVMTPVGVAFALIAIHHRTIALRPKAGGWLLVALVIGAAANVANAAVEHWKDPRPGAVAQAFPAVNLSSDERVRRWHEWQWLGKWVSEHSQPGDLFLTPRNQQTFKWDAGRPEVVNGKDFPQDAAAIVAWRKRMDDIFPYTVRFADLAAHGEPRLLELSRKYGFRYIIIDRGISTRRLKFPRVYPEASPAIYEIYRVPTT
jgi:hypothetical protein